MKNMYTVEILLRKNLFLMLTSTTLKFAEGQPSATHSEVRYRLHPKGNHKCAILAVCQRERQRKKVEGESRGRRPKEQVVEGWGRRHTEKVEGKVDGRK